MRRLLVFVELLCVCIMYTEVYRVSHFNCLISQKICKMRNNVSDKRKEGGREYIKFGFDAVKIKSSLRFILQIF